VRCTRVCNTRARIAVVAVTVVLACMIVASMVVTIMLAMFRRTSAKTQRGNDQQSSDAEFCDKVDRIRNSGFVILSAFGIRHSAFSGIVFHGVRSSWLVLWNAARRR
jgi:hypothetical protein